MITTSPFPTLLLEAPVARETTSLVGLHKFHLQYQYLLPNLCPSFSGAQKEQLVNYGPAR